jgi:hypothetical protein
VPERAIAEVFLFVTTGEDGAEAVVGGQMPDGSMMPLIAVDRARMEALLPTAQNIAVLGAMEIRVVRFGRADDVSAVERIIHPTD